MSVTVVNKYKEPDHIYCGRGSALGNPYSMPDESLRDSVCSLYEDWFYRNIDDTNFLDLYRHSQNGADYTARTQTKQTRMLLAIFKKALVENVNLGCFCAPKRCHCDTIKSYIDNKIVEYTKS